MTIEDLVAQRTRIERAAKRRQLTGDEFDACQRLSMEIRRLQAEAGPQAPDPRIPWELRATKHSLADGCGR